MKGHKNRFSGKIGFIMAAAGSAVGLGNLWRFPYLAAKYGGGMFILVYILLTVSFGFTLLLTELAIGRRTRKSALGAYRDMHHSFRFVGWLCLLVPVIVLPYYCVIGGWVLKYMIVFLTGQGMKAGADDFFHNYVGTTVQPLLFFVLFLLLTAMVVRGGIQSGVERISKLLMPLLLLITIGVSVYTILLPGADKGVQYYLLPHWSDFSIKTICAAMGQLFFSMSIAMGTMIAFGSYVGDEENLIHSVHQIEFFDTVVALLAGLMIVPAVYLFQGEEGLSQGGPGLMFDTLPRVFSRMPMGQVIGAVFFLLVFAAALTSSVAMLETLVAMILDGLKQKQRKNMVGRSVVVLLVTPVVFLIGIPVSLGHGIWDGLQILGMDLLSFSDFVANSMIMPIIALMTCILVGWKLEGYQIEQEITRNGESFRSKMLYRVMLRYIAPVILAVILIFYTMVQFEVIVI